MLIYDRLRKKGAKIGDYLANESAKKAFAELREAVVADALLHVPDYEAAANAVETGRPFEIYIDASEYAWGCVLSQRMAPGGAPRPIAIFSRSFNETEQAWSAFERELYGLREGLAACEPYTKGFKVIVLTDHKNNLFTGSLLANRRVNKKLLRWAIDLEELGDKVQRVWIRGVDNILGDPPSRNPSDRDVCRRLKVPAGPVRRIIQKMFEAPMEMDEEIAAMHTFLDGLDDAEEHPRSKKTAGQQRDAPAADSSPTDPSAADATPPSPLKAPAPVDPSDQANPPIEQTPCMDAGTAATPTQSAAQPTPATDTAGPEAAAETSSLDVSASWPSSLFDSAPDALETNSEPVSFLYCAGPHGSRYPLDLALIPPADEEEVAAVTLTSTSLDGVFPRKHLTQFLPARTAGGEDAGTKKDPRAPSDPKVLPYRIAHVVDDRGENFVVQYQEKQKCLDGVLRKSMWYQCKNKTCTPGSVEHKNGHLKAEAAAWAHVEQVLARGESADLVDARYGTGELRGTGRFRHHGDPHEDFRFYSHPRRPDFNKGGSVIWRPGRDTLSPAAEYCKDCRFVRRMGTGVEIWQCSGHDVHTGEPAAEEWPPGFADAPLQNLTLVEVFSGIEADGGCMLSRCWEAAGGSAIRYDSRIDETHNFFEDAEFWKEHLEHPKDAYHFAFPCHHMSIAHSTPRVRTAECPYGDEADEDTAYYNRLARLMVDRMLKLVAGGAMILLEQPLLSYLLLFRELQGLMGMPGIFLLRADDCMSGTPYMKPRAWFTTAASLAGSTAAVCSHPNPHPEQITGGGKSRSTAPYPKVLVIKLVEGVISELEVNGSLVNNVAKEAAQLYLESLGARRRLRKAAPTMAFSAPPFDSWVASGAAKVRQIRHGTAIASHTVGDDLTTPASDPAPEAAEPGNEEPPTGSAVFTAVSGSLGQFERKELQRLQREDPDFRDIWVAHAALLQLEATAEGTAVSDAALYEAVRRDIVDANGRNRSKRADTAVVVMGQYSLVDGLLFRKVWQETDNSHGDRLVIPAGGRRAFMFNGRRYRLPLRRAMLLLYHDSETMGGHASARDTLAKLERNVWWPTLERDTSNWVHACSVCRLTKPQAGITTDQRMELHDRPFRVLFTDAIGPIHPKDGEFEYLFHAEDPFSRWCWVAPAKSDSAEEWAAFLVEQVFFDICGFPAVLRTDRGAAYTSSLVAAVNAMLGVTHVFGSAFHPEPQGYIESRHKPINSVLAAYASAHPENWARWARLAQWVLRATPRADRGGRSPYELVCGLVPQGPIDSLFRKINSTRTMSCEDYVAGLRDNLQKIHEEIGMQIRADHSAKQSRAERTAEPSHIFQVGDMVFLKRPPAALQSKRGGRATVSQRLLPNADPQLYEIAKVISPQTVVLRHPDTKETALGFGNPVSTARLIPFDLPYLETPMDNGTPLYLEIYRQGQWIAGRIVSQSATGAVRVEYDDKSEETVQLDREEYRWVYPRTARPNG